MAGGDSADGENGDDGDVNFHIKFLRRRCAWDGRWPEFGVHGWRLVDARREGVTCGLVPMLGGHLWSWHLFLGYQDDVLFFLGFGGLHIMYASEEE